MRFKQGKSGLFVPDREIVQRRGRCNGLMHARAMGGSNGYNYVRLYVFTNSSGGTTNFNYTYVFRIFNRANTNILTGGTASASSTFASQTADNAFNGDYATYHSNASGVFPYYIQYQFSAPVDLADLAILELYCSQLGTFEIRISNDPTFSSYDVIASSNYGEWYTQYVGDYPFYYPLKAVEAWKLLITSAGSTGTASQYLLKGIELRDLADSALTGSTNCFSPYYSSASNTYTQMYNMWLNFNSTYSFANSTTAGDLIANGKTFFGFIMKPGVTINPAKLALASTFNSNCPRAFTLYKKAAGSTVFNVINSWATTWPNNNPQTFSI